METLLLTDVLGADCLGVPERVEKHNLLSLRCGRLPVFVYLLKDVLNNECPL
jgi:hypothetical protein